MSTSLLHCHNYSKFVIKFEWQSVVMSQVPQTEAKTSGMIFETKELNMWVKCNLMKQTSCGKCNDCTLPQEWHSQFHTASGIGRFYFGEKLMQEEAKKV